MLPVPAKSVPAKPVPAKSVPAKPSAQLVRGLGKCLLLSPQAAVALRGSTLGSPAYGKYTWIFQVEAIEQNTVVCMLEIKPIFHSLKSKRETTELGHSCNSTEDLVII